MIKNKKSTVLIAVFIAVVMALSTTTLTLAIWKEQINVDKVTNLPLEDTNPSFKYLAFVPTDELGNYNATSPTEYAVVGYGGLVAEVVIPDTYNGKKVTRIMPNANNQLNQFKNNKVIKSLTISCNIKYIAPTVFSNILTLEWVKFMDSPYGSSAPYDSGNVSIGEYAFMGCAKLTQFICNRAIIGSNRESYLLNTGVK